MSNRVILILSAVTVLILGAAIFFNKCSDNRSEKKIQQHKYTLSTALDIDSLNTLIAEEQRRQYEDTIKALRAKKDNVQIRYRHLTAKDKELETSYRAEPSLEKCDSVISSKNTRIATLEQLDSLNVKTIVQQQGIIANSDRLIESKTQTISDLSIGYSEAIRDLEKASKPKRIVVSAGIGYGVTGSGKLEPNAGVQIGYKLFQF